MADTPIHSHSDNSPVTLAHRSALDKVLQDRAAEIRRSLTRIRCQLEQDYDRKHAVKRIGDILQQVRAMVDDAYFEAYSALVHELSEPT